MTRHPTIQPGSGFEDEDRDLRPQRMGEMVGQREVYARLEIVVDAAMKRAEPLGHVLFDGPPGLGNLSKRLDLRGLPPRLLLRSRINKTFPIRFWHEFIPAEWVAAPRSGFVKMGVAQTAQDREG